MTNTMKAKKRQRELWLYVLGMVLFCRLEQLLLCVRRELYIRYIPHAALSQSDLSRKRVIPEGPEECLCHWFQSRMTSLENCFLFPVLSLSFSLSLSPQLGMLKVEVGAWALHTLWKHTALHMCQTHPRWEQQSTHSPLFLYTHDFCCFYASVSFTLSLSVLICIISILNIIKD